MNQRLLLWGNVLVKVALLLLLAHAVVFAGLPQYVGKGIAARLVLYPLGVAVVPLAWLLVRRRRVGGSPAYPLLADLLVSSPFTIDTLGNALNLFNTVEVWDDIMHFTQWALLMGGLGLLLRPRVGRRWVFVLLVVSLGAHLAVWWEVAEYFAFIRVSPELQTAYTDTLGDLVLGTLGACLAAGLLLRRWPADRLPC